MRVTAPAGMRMRMRSRREPVKRPTTAPNQQRPNRPDCHKAERGEPGFGKVCSIVCANPRTEHQSSDQQYCGERLRKTGRQSEDR